MADFEIETLHGELCYAKRDSMGDLRIELGSVFNGGDFITEAFGDE